MSSSDIFTEMTQIVVCCSLLTLAYENQLLNFQKFCEMVIKLLLKIKLYTLTIKNILKTKELNIQINHFLILLHFTIICVTEVT